MAKKIYKKIFKIILITLLSLFVLLNIVAAIQAYGLTHFNEEIEALPSEKDLSSWDKIGVAICGLDLPKPRTKSMPNRAYDSLKIAVDENKSLDAWVMHTDSVRKGIVLLFHGYMDEKSSMLNRAYFLLDMGYDVMLVDFRGAGGSYGTQSTWGYYEAENVKTVFDYVLTNMDQDDIYLLGFSMGAVAILKAQSDYNLLVKGIILEASYGTFLETVGSRLDLYNLPHFPMKHLFTFWNSVENDFNAFELNPEEYARNIHVPTMIMCGVKDPYISQVETQTIFDNISSEHKELKLFTESAHESYLIKHADEWKASIGSFLKELYIEDVY